MYREKRIATMMPCLNEERLIGKTIEATPDFIDFIIITDDCSTDGTYEIARHYQEKDPRIHIIRHKKNMGVGFSLVEEYHKMVELGGDIAVGIGGDLQMPMEQIPNLLDPIINGEAEVVKGNRFSQGGTIEGMPTIKIIGNTMISMLCKISSGYWKLFDVVDGFVAVSKEAINRVDWSNPWRGYGYPMEHLARYNIANVLIKEVPRRAIYLKGERQSQIKGFNYFLKCSPMMLRLFFRRLWKKYTIQNGHPLVFLYLFGMLSTLIGVILAVLIVLNKFIHAHEYIITGATAIMTAMFLLLGFNALFFAMFFDMLDNEKLQK